MAQILVFGDSITYGAWDREGGWVSRLRKFLDGKRLADSDSYFLVYNLGISGDNTDGLLERFEFEAKQRLDEENGNIIAFAIGINDSQFVQSKKSFRVIPEKFKENIQKIIRLAQRYSTKIVFVGLTPVDEAKTSPLPWNADRFYKNEYIQKYGGIVKDVCKENKICFIEISGKFMKSDYTKLLEDGLHPNSEGHKIIFEIVKDFLVKEKII